MNKLEEIRDGIIKESFPELLAEDISVEYKDLKDALMEYGPFSSEGFYIEVDNSMKLAPVDVLRGGLAHELCHIVVEIEIGRKSAIRDRIACKISKRYRTLDERNTDLMVIVRGYGKELLSFMRYSESKGYPYYKEEGLSIRELEILLSLGKSD